MTIKSIIEYKLEVAGSVPEINMITTIMKIDKAITWCVNHIQSLEKALLDGPKGNAVTTQEVLDLSQKTRRSFIYKFNGAITDCTIDLAKPICPICSRELPTYQMSKPNPEKGFASVPVYRCEHDRMYFNWSRNNKEGWE